MDSILVLIECYIRLIALPKFYIQCCHVIRLFGMCVILGIFMFWKKAHLLVEIAVRVK